MEMDLIDYRKLIPRASAEYLAKYNAASVNANRFDLLRTRALQLIKYQARYEKVSSKYGKMPWWIVACIHNEENGIDVGSFKAVLHNGEKIIGTGLRTAMVPKNRGPFNSWEDAAIDALNIQHTSDWRDWSLGGCLFFGERFNGSGYCRRGLPSPYLWAMTNMYQKGAYVSDGKFDAETVSKNFGIAAILKLMAQEGIEIA